MAGWETVLAAVGGLLVGLGLGITVGRRQEDSLRVERAQAEAQIRKAVLPVLEQRIAQLAIDRIDRTPENDRDPVQLAVDLATTIRRFEDDTALPFTDTVQVGPGAKAAPAANEVEA